MLLLLILRDSLNVVCSFVVVIVYYSCCCSWWFCFIHTHMNIFQNCFCCWSCFRFSFTGRHLCVLFNVYAKLVNLPLFRVFYSSILRFHFNFKLFSLFFFIRVILFCFIVFYVFFVFFFRRPFHCYFLLFRINIFLST